MSLSAELDTILPYEARLNPEYGRAVATHVEWPKNFSLITDDVGERRHRSGNYADLACRFYPTATGADLDLGVDLMSWFFLLDDQFDGPLGSDLDKSHAVVSELEAVLAEPPGPGRSAGRTKIAVAFGDIWRRTCEPMPDHFVQRARQNWINYFRGYLTETEAKRNGRQFSRGEYLAVRRATIGVLPTLDMAERVTLSALPSRLYDRPTITAQRAIAIDVNVLFNDVASYGKELELGEVNNLVLILTEGQHQGAVERAAREIVHLAGNLIREFTVLNTVVEQHLAGIYDLSRAEREALANYQRNALVTLIRGSLDWHRTSGRYKADFAHDAARQPHVDDLLAAYQAP
jgi:pentalenene synthase